MIIHKMIMAKKLWAIKNYIFPINYGMGHGITLAEH